MCWAKTECDVLKKILDEVNPFSFFQCLLYKKFHVVEEPAIVDGAIWAQVEKSSVMLLRRPFSSKNGSATLENRFLC